MNDYTPLADLYHVHVPDVRDDGFWARGASEVPGLAVLEPAGE